MNIDRGIEVRHRSVECTCHGNYSNRLTRGWRSLQMRDHRNPNTAHVKLRRAKTKACPWSWHGGPSSPFIPLSFFLSLSPSCFHFPLTLLSLSITYLYVSLARVRCRSCSYASFAGEYYFSHSISCVLLCIVRSSLSREIFFRIYDTCMPGAASPRPINNIPLRPDLPTPSSPIPIPRSKPQRDANGRFTSMSNRTQYPPGPPASPQLDTSQVPGPSGASSFVSVPGNLATRFSTQPSRSSSPTRPDPRMQAIFDANTRTLEERIEQRLSAQSALTNQLSEAIATLTKALLPPSQASARNAPAQGSSNVAAAPTLPASFFTPAINQQAPPALLRTMPDQQATPLIPTPPVTVHTQAHVPLDGFTPPLTNNPAAGAYPSIASLFPHVHQDTLHSVIRHELRAEDLYKLDFRFREQSLDLPLTVCDGQIRYAGTDIAARYKSPESLITPLH